MVLTYKQTWYMGCYFSDELARQLEVSESKFVFTVPELVETARKAANQVQGVKVLTRIKSVSQLILCWGILNKKCLIWLILFYFPNTHTHVFMHMAYVSVYMHVCVDCQTIPTVPLIKLEYGTKYNCRYCRKYVLPFNPLTSFKSIN